MKLAFFTLCSVLSAVVFAQSDDLPRKAAFGVSLGPATEAEAKAAGIPANVAAKITRVSPGMTAAALDVKVGDILVTFGGEAYRGPPSSAPTARRTFRVRPLSWRSSVTGRGRSSPGS